MFRSLGCRYGRFGKTCRIPSSKFKQSKKPSEILHSAGWEIVTDVSICRGKQHNIGVWNEDFGIEQDGRNEPQNLVNIFTLTS